MRQQKFVLLALICYQCAKYFQFSENVYSTYYVTYQKGLYQKWY